MFPVTQIDTFYNSLTFRHRDTINVAAGGTIMKRRPKECFDLIKKMTAHNNDWDTSSQWSESSSSITSSSDMEITALKVEMAEINKNLIRVLQVNQQVKAVTPNCETCGGPHSFSDCPATIGNTQNVYVAGAYQAYQVQAYQAPVYQALVHQPQIPQPQVITNNEFTNFMKANDAILKNMQTNMTSLTNSNLELKNMFGQFMKMNTTSFLGARTLPSNTITNPKEDLKGITTQSGTAYQGPTIPTTSSSFPVVERETEATKDMVHPTNNESTKDVQPPIVQTESLILNSKPVISPIIEPKLRDRANDQREKFLQIFKDLNFNISFTDALILMPKFSPSIKILLTNKDKLCELARTPLNEHCSTVLLNKLLENLGDPGKFLIPCDFPEMAECLALADLGASINLMPLSVWNKLSLPNLSPTCMTLELANRLISRPVGVAEDVFVKRSFLKTRRALIDVFKSELTLHVGKEAITFNLDQTLRYSANYNDMTANRIDVINLACEEYSQEVLSFFDVELKNLPPHLEYGFLEGDDKLPVIITKDLSVEDKTALIMVLKSHKRAIARKLSDIKDHEKTIFTCPYGTLAYRRMPFGLRNAPGTFQRYMMAIIHDMLKRCKETNLCLNWEKSHFLVKEGIVLGHKSSKEEIEVNKAKVYVIAKLPHPTTVKGIRSFLGHAGFYRKFIKDFSKIARPMTRLLEKDTPFLFSKECVETFPTLKRKLTEASILIALDWDLPFELMCDASDFAIGAVLGQRQEKHFRPITMPREQIHTRSYRLLVEMGGSKGAPHKWSSSSLQILEKSLCQIWNPRAIISDRGTHFCNDQFTKVMLKFGVTHRLATPYHPQTSGQVEVSNHGSKPYKTPIGCTPYNLVYRKACHLLIELEHKFYWALKHANFDLQTAGDHKKIQLNELNELRDQAYENSLIYKEKSKSIHDSKIKYRVFNISDRVLLFNSRLKSFSGKMKSHCSGPFTVSHVFAYGTVELSQPDGPNFKVSGHRLKIFLERIYQRWLSLISKHSLRTNEFGDWLKLSDPKQALRGRHPMLIPSLVMNKMCVVG
nr:reverse transcriptase domain-containing protein [Tanacetum cinerariifolium]